MTLAPSSDFDLIWRLSDVTSKLKPTTTSTIYVYKYTQFTTSVYQCTLFGVPACSWRLCMTCSNLMNLDMSSNFKTLHVLNILKPHGTKPQETWIWGVVSEECARPHPNTKWVEQLAIGTCFFFASRNISVAKCIPEPNQWKFAVVYLLNLPLQTNNLVDLVRDIPRSLSPLPGRSFWIGLVQGKHVGVLWWMYKNAKVPIVRWLPSLMNH